MLKVSGILILQNKGEMDIRISAKQLGKKRPIIAPRQIEIDDIGRSPTLRKIITAIVCQQTAEYNDKTTAQSLLTVLNPDQIKTKASGGKIDFGEVYNENTAETKKAVETALQAYEDGLFCVFAGDDQINTLDDCVELSSRTVLTFVRLTFLSGRSF